MCAAFSFKAHLHAHMCTAKLLYASHLIERFVNCQRESRVMTKFNLIINSVSCLILHTCCMENEK